MILVIGLFVILDISLVLGIAVASRRRGRSQWDRRRDARSIFELAPSADGLIRTLLRKRRPLPPELLVRELSRRARTPASQSDVRALVGRVQVIAGGALNDALTAAIDSSRRPAARATRRRARLGARLLGRLPSSERVPSMIALLETDDGCLLIDVLVAIAQSPSHYASALVALPRLMKDDRPPRVKLVATWACVRVLRQCPDAWPLVQGDASPGVRATVVRAAMLASADSALPSDEARDVMLRASTDPASEVRLAGTVALRQFRSDRAMQDAAYQALRDSVQEIRIAAASAIVSGTSMADISRTADALSRTDAGTAHALLKNLSAAAESKWMRLVPIATDSRSPYRHAAITLLGTDAHPRAQLALAGLFDDDDPGICLEAAAAAALVARVAYPNRLEQTLVQRLLGVLHDSSDTAFLLHAIDALACSGHPDVPASLVTRIPGSAGSIRERLIDASALFDHLSRWVERPTSRAVTA